MSPYVSAKSPMRGRREAREVEALVRLVARLVDEEEAGHDPERSRRDVDEEDPAPVEVLGDEAADERADRERERGRPAQIPIAVPRSRGGKVAAMIESVAGFISAAPAPWRTRAPMSISDEPARPHSRGREREDDDPDDEDAAAARTRPRPCRRRASATRT